MKWLVAVLALLLVYTASTVQADAPVDEEQYIVIRTGTGDEPARLLLSVDGQPLKQIWNVFFDRLFALLDRDGDHRLSAVEAARAPSPAWLKTQWRGDFDNVPTPFVAWQDIDQSPKDNHVTAAELATYYRAAGLGQVELQSGRGSPALDPQSTRRLFERIAGGANAAWDETKMATAAEKLRRFDFNDDERWSAEELKSSDHVGGSSDKNSSAAQPVASIELSAERKKPLLKIDLLTKGDMPGEIHAAPSDRPDSLTVVDKGTMVRIRVVSGHGKETFHSACQSLLQQFEIDDLDRNQALDLAEAMKSPLSDTFKALLTLADRNTDGKSAAAELQQYLELQAAAAGQHVILVVANHGVPLFEMLDADEDGAISLRELRTAWSRVATRSSRDKASRVTWNDLPRKYEWTLSLGLPKPTAPQRIARSVELAPPPDWFAKMDRNNDGDLSRREFLGETNEFRRLDQDADGLISPGEAMQGFPRK
jgi:hypothetical protein